jgi:predicted outer membrane lipoprotein
MAGGALLACGFAALPAVWPPPPEQAAMTRHAPAAPASQLSRPRYDPMIPRIPRTLSLT